MVLRTREFLFWLLNCIAYYLMLDGSLLFDFIRGVRIATELTLLSLSFQLTYI